MKNFIVFFFVILFFIPTVHDSRPGGGQTYRSSSSSSRSSSSSYKSSSSTYRSSSSSYSSPKTYSAPKTYSPTSSSGKTNYRNHATPEEDYLSLEKKILSPKSYPWKLDEYILKIAVKQDTGFFVREEMKILSAPSSTDFQFRHLIPVRWGKDVDSPTIKFLDLHSNDHIQSERVADYDFQGNYYQPSRELAFSAPTDSPKIIIIDYTAYNKQIPEMKKEKKKDSKPYKFIYNWKLVPINSNDYSEFGGGDFEIQVPAENFSYEVDPKNYSVSHEKSLNLIRGKVQRMSKSKSNKPPEITIEIPEEALDETQIPVTVFSSEDYISKRDIQIQYKTDGSSFIREKFIHHKVLEYDGLMLSFNYHQPVFETEKTNRDIFYYDLNTNQNLSRSYFEESMYLVSDSNTNLDEQEYSLNYKTFGSLVHEGNSHWIRFGIAHSPSEYHDRINLEVDLPKEWKVNEKNISVWKVFYGSSLAYSEPLVYNQNKEKVEFIFLDHVLKAKVPLLKNRNAVVFEISLDESSVFSSFSFFSKILLILTRLHNTHIFKIYFTLFAALSIGVTYIFVKRNKIKKEKQAILLLEQIEKKRKIQSEADSKKAKEEKLKLENEIRLKLNDPDFSLDGFFAKVKKTGIELTNDWLSGDLSKSRSLVSSGIYNRFRTQLRLLKHEGLVNTMEDWGMYPQRLKTIDIDNQFHIAHVFIQGFAKDMNLPVSLSESERKRKMAGQKKAGYQEYWTFIRKNQAKTKKGILDGVCPNCGAVADNVSQSNKCIHCSTIYNSSLFDWVLTEITQTDEWGKNKGADSISGLKEIHKFSSFISKQIIEDRASAIFWRWIEAQVFRNKQSIARDATLEYINSLILNGRFISEPSVGSVELLGVTNESGSFYAKVEIYYSARFSEDGDFENRKVILLLTLSGQCKSTFGIADHSCPSCGGVLPESDSLKCEYCAGDLPVKNDDWLLHSLKES